MTEKELFQIINEIKFLNWEFKARIGVGNGMELQLVILIPTVDIDNPSEKTIILGNHNIPLNFLLSLHPKQVVRIIFEAIFDQLKHEAGELFYYKGERPYNDHNTEEKQTMIERIFLREPIIA